MCRESWGRTSDPALSAALSFVARERKNGVDTEHYRADAAALRRVRPAVLSTASLDVWIAAAGYLSALEGHRREERRHGRTNRRARGQQSGERRVPGLLNGEEPAGGNSLDRLLGSVRQVGRYCLPVPPLTTLLTVSVLFARFGSGVVLVTVATFTILPTDPLICTWISNVTSVPAGSVAAVHVTWCVPGLYVQFGDRNCTISFLLSSGSVSTTTTFAAAFGPPVPDVGVESATKPGVLCTVIV